MMGCSRRSGPGTGERCGSVCRQRGKDHHPGSEAQGGDGKKDYDPHREGFMEILSEYVDFSKNEELWQWSSGSRAAYSLVEAG